MVDISEPEGSFTLSRDGRVMISVLNIGICFSFLCTMLTSSQLWKSTSFRMQNQILNLRVLYCSIIFTACRRCKTTIVRSTPSLLLISRVPSWCFAVMNKVQCLSAISFFVPCRLSQCTAWWSSKSKCFKHLIDRNPDQRNQGREQTGWCLMCSLSWFGARELG